METSENNTDRATTCLTQDLSSLDLNAANFDVVVVGSGYGAAMATFHLSQLAQGGNPLNICVLERGNEYLDGSFPRDPAELAGHVRISTPGSEEASGNFDGLFDIRGGGDVSSLIGNGFGGGSLINAGVMIEPLDSVFNSWPIGSADLPFAESRTLLQARPLEAGKLPRKYHELKTIAPITKPADITVFDSCNSCGNCATGCNFGHKASLDRTLFSRALENNPNIKFITGATVVQIEKADGEWKTHIIPTRKNLRDRMPKGEPSPYVTTSAQIVVAAGTFGSTEILMKSKAKGLAISDQLGKRFSSNGDMLAVGFKRNQLVNAISRSPLPGDSSKEDVGPTITGVADYRETDGILLQEMNVPFPIANFFDEIFSTSASVTNTTKKDFTNHSPADKNDPFSLDRNALERTSVYAMMSDDGANGEIVQNVESEKGDGLVSVRWPKLKKAEIFRRQIEFLEKKSEATGGIVIANPLWRPLPKVLDFLAGEMEGPLVTVHPLGGCSIARNQSSGVVNHLGQVFNCDSEDSVYEGLVVLDGSVIPTSLGANPALTISAVALRAIRKLANGWQYESHNLPETRLPTRKIYRKIDTFEVTETKVQIVERMAGAIELPGCKEKLTLELTMRSRPTSVQMMTRPEDRRVVLSDTSYLRLYRTREYQEMLLRKSTFNNFDCQLNDIAIAKFGIEGTMNLFPRGSSTFLTRLWQGTKAYALNRAARDLWQTLVVKESAASISLGTIFSTFSHAGEIRTMDYSLRLTKCLKPPHETFNFKLDVGDVISGKKTITYKRAANPLRQMSEMALDHFGSAHFRTSKPVVTLQPEFLAKEGIPLLHVVKQDNSVNTLLDLMSLGGYVARMLLSIHSLTFRLPDTYRQAPMSRLPKRIPRVPNFEQIRLHDHENKELPALLTRYEVKGGQPVLMMHGYSASGTTFTHETLPEPFARYLFKKGYDVWILDARTSSGLPTAEKDWAFEEVGEEDIPAAIQHVYREVNLNVSPKNKQKVKIVAHCMGAAMFSMAVLRDNNGIEGMIDRVAMTQVGPGVVVSPGNIFRAYMLRYFKQFLNLERFDFRVENSDSLTDQLIDRLLNVLPYTDEEFKRENPAWPPWKRTEWVGIRHRMDMLWGETFELENVGEPVLNDLDALFGTLNLDTLSQVIPLSKWMNVTDKSGKNLYFQHNLLRKHWDFDTLSLHTTENGLWSPATLTRNRRFLKHLNHTYSTKLIPSFGHQDIWLSKKSEHDIYPHIHNFFKGETDCFSNTTPVPERKNLRFIRTAHLGPIISHDFEPSGTQNTILRFGKRPNVGIPFLALVIEVKRNGKDHYESAIPLNNEDWIMHIAQAKVFLSELPMYRMKKDLKTNKSYLVLLVNLENADLGHETFPDGTEDGAEDDGTTKNLFTKPTRPHESGLTPAEVKVLGKYLQPIGEEIEEFLSEKKKRVRRGLIHPKPIQPGNTLTMVIGSCQYTAGIIDDRVAFDSYRALKREMDPFDFGLDNNKPALDLMLLLGDQIYVDATAGLFDPLDQVQAFFRPYEKWLFNRNVRNIMRKLPSYMMLDDHEINENWEPGHDEEKLDLGRKAFKLFQFGKENARDPDQFWGPIEASPLPIFMLNSRTDRDSRIGTQAKDAQMLSDTQFKALIQWVDSAPEDKPCIICSSSILLPRHYPVNKEEDAATTLDTIDGYPATFAALLAMVAARPNRVFLFLSGDEHIPLVATIQIFDDSNNLITKTHSVHTSSLYAPYPFANGDKHQLIDEEKINLTLPSGDISCAVSVEHFDAVPGFTRIEIAKNVKGWELKGRMVTTGKEFSLSL